MKHLPEIYRAVECIEQHLKEPIRISDAADEAGFSLYHFTRIFNSVTGHSPYDYLMRRRLSESAKELARSNRKIIDIALDYQFNSPETFSRAFRKMFGILPNQVKREGTLSDLVLRSAIRYEYLEYIHQGEFPHPQWVERPALHLAGTVCPGDRKTIPLGIWEEILRQFPATGQSLSGCYYSVDFNTLHWSAHGYRFCGVEVDSLTSIPPLLLGKSFPAQQYVKFVHKGRPCDLEKTFEYIYQTWFPRSGKALPSPVALESYNPFQTPQGKPDVIRGCDILIPMNCRET